MNRIDKEEDAQPRNKRTKKAAATEADEQAKNSGEDERKEDDIFEALEEKILRNIKKISEIGLPKVNMGVLFNGVDKVYKSIKDYDEVISKQANVVSTKVVDYFRKSIADTSKKK